MKWARYLCVLLATLAAIVSFHPIAGAQKKEVRRVLILNEGGLQYPSIAFINQAIRESLQGSKYRVEMYSEYMETNLFPDEADQKLFREFYVRKYQNHRPDVIITVGSSPLRFMKEEFHKHFTDIPVVFCEANGLEDDFKHEPGFTGVTMGIEAATTLNAALQLLPSTRHVFVVSGGISPFDRQEVQKVKEQLEDYSSRLDITYVTGLAMPVLLKRLNSVPEGTIVLLTSFGRDADGVNYTSSDAGPLISSAANAPVFSLFDVFIGHGEVGGNLSQIRAQGTIAGSVALRILDGVNPNDVPVAKAPNEFVFDWRALERWGIKESNLPPGSVVLNREPTVWESYKRYILGGTSLLCLQALIIVALMWQRAERMKAETGMVLSNNRLRESEERFRLVANTAPVLIWMAGPDKLCNYFNQPWLEFTGRPLEAELGNGWAKGVHPEDIRDCMDTYSNAFERRESFKMEYRLRRNDGEYRWLFDIGVPRFDPNGAFVGYIGSCNDVTERKSAEEALASLSSQLIEAQEEERKRIARELHDDYNQRLAMLALDLENVAENIGDSSADAAQQLQEFFERVSELGADLHSLSHRLHSSTLESLGLVAGVKAFCKEFAEQQGIQVEFAHENVPHDIPEDAALCIFRIAQEGLRNIKRHSGADRAEVRLEGLEEKLHLSITDSGRGFDVNKRSAQSGIGIRSMKERLRYLGGHLEVHSRPMAGTTIDAWLPFKAHEILRTG